MAAGSKEVWQWLGCIHVKSARTCLPSFVHCGNKRSSGRKCHSIEEGQTTAISNFSQEPITYIETG